MGIVIKDAEDADMLAVFTVAARAFDRNENFFDATFPQHWTDEGKAAGAERFLHMKQNDPNIHYIKAVDTDTGAIAGFARWLILKDHIPNPPPNDHGPYWESAEDADYFNQLLTSFMAQRAEYIQKTGGNVVSLDICAVDPAYQRRGVGNQLVEWGVKKADEQGLDAVVESSPFGRGLYEKHGFVFEKMVQLQATGPYADRSHGGFAWLTRPKRSRT